jgi:hypothetical protein
MPSLKLDDLANVPSNVNSAASTIDDSAGSQIVRGNRDGIKALASPVVVGNELPVNVASPPLSNAVSASGELTSTPTGAADHSTAGPDGKVRCGGCKEMIDQSSGGVVVAFGYVFLPFANQSTPLG